MCLLQGGLGVTRIFSCLDLRWSHTNLELDDIVACWLYLSLFISVVECYFLQDCNAQDPGDYYPVSLVVSLRSEAGTVILKHYLGRYS